MVNRWGTAVLALAFFATPLATKIAPLAAQEPSLETSESAEDENRVIIMPTEPVGEDLPDPTAAEPSRTAA